MLLLALMWGGNDYAWSSPRVIGLFCGALATFLVWILWNRYLGEDALIPPSMVAKTAVWVSALFQAMLMAAVFGVVYYLPIYFQAVKNVDALLSGVYLLPMIIPQLVFAAAAGIFCECWLHWLCEEIELVNNAMPSHESRLCHTFCGLWHSFAIRRVWAFLDTAAQ